MVQHTLAKRTYKKKGQVNLAILSSRVCVNLLNDSILTRKAALQSEVAIGVSLFYAAKTVSRDSKQMLGRIYAEAGYDCSTKLGQDYKTVNRRINAAAALFEKIGFNSLHELVNGKTEYQLVGLVQERVKSLELVSIEDVLTYTGKNTRKLLEGTDSGVVVASKYRVDVGDLHIKVPKTSSPEEIMEVAQRLMSLAKELEESRINPHSVSALEAAIHVAGRKTDTEPMGETQKDSGIVPGFGATTVEFKEQKHKPKPKH